LPTAAHADYIPIMRKTTPDPQNTDHLFYDTLPLRCPPDMAYAAKTTIAQLQSRIRQTRHHPMPDLELLQHLATALTHYRTVDLSLPHSRSVTGQEQIQRQIQ